MDYKELKNKSLPELHRLLAEKREELRVLRSEASANQLKNVRAIRKNRLIIARILTAINNYNENKE